MRIAQHISELIGNTPLVQLSTVVPEGAGVVAAKVEYLNPGGSSKDRIAVKMVDAAEASGELKPGGTIVEGTAGNTGIGLALVMRILLLSMIWVIVSLTTPVFDLGIQGATGAHGAPSFETAFSWRDLILIAGGLFLLWKATKEIHHTLDPVPSDDEILDKKKVVGLNFGSAIFQIILLDMVFSVDSILTAVGMTDEIAIMVTAVLVTVAVMLVAADPLANFIKHNPTVVMLALGFLLMIGAVLIADGFGVHVPKGYIYAAMAFSALVESLNMIARRAKLKREGGGQPPAA